MPGNPGSIWHGASGLTHPTDILGSIAEGRESGRLLGGGISGVQGGETGGTSVSHYIQCGDVCGGPELGREDCRERRRAGRAQTGGQTPKWPLLRRWRHDIVVIPGMDAEGFSTLIEMFNWLLGCIL